MIFLPSAKFLYRPQTATNIVTPLHAWEADHGVQTVGTDGVTVDAVPVSGNKVKQWTSKVGGVVLTQTVDANRPTYYQPAYGKPYIAMDGRTPTRFLQTESASTFFTNLDKITMGVAIRRPAYTNYRSDIYVAFNYGNVGIPSIRNTGTTPQFLYGGDPGGLGGTFGSISSTYDPSAEITIFGTFSTASTSQTVSGAASGKIYLNGSLDATNTSTPTTRTTTPGGFFVGKAENTADSGVKEFYGVYPYEQELTGVQVAASHADIANRLFSWQALPVTGASIWLDASRSDTLFVENTLTTPVTTDNGPVGGWKDLSGNNRHALQSTNSARPTWRTPINGVNGLGVTSYNGSTQFFAVSNTIGWGLVYSGDFTISFVHKVSAASGGILISHDNGAGVIPKWTLGYGSNGIVGSGFIGLHYNGGVDLANAGAGAAATIVAATVKVAFSPTAGQTYQITVARSGNNHLFYIDGVQIGATQVSSVRPGNPTVNASIGWAEGASATFIGGSIAETVVYPTYLNATQLASVKSYLSAKWGTP